MQFAVPEPVSELIDAMRLLVDLQRVSEVAQSFSGCLEPEQIAKRTTDSLIEKFDFTFTRIWLVEPDQTALRLVASSGMYTHTNGSFARVPMGSFKVGKIAQNRIPFLSNNLPNEPWVKDRDWAIAHNITGFAGYPLIVADRVIGVIAIFSNHPLSPELLEVLQGLCSTLTVTLDNALHYQRERQTWQVFPKSAKAPLSEQLATILPATRLILVGTERSLPLSLSCVLLHAAESLQPLNCVQCRLTYSADQVSLETMVFPPANLSSDLQNWANSTFGDLLFATSCLGGNLQTYAGANQDVVQLMLTLPYTQGNSGKQICIQCKSPVLQMAFTHLSFLAGLTVCSQTNHNTPLLTDDATQIQAEKHVLWIHQGTQAIPKGIKAKVDLSTNAAHLRQAVEAVIQDQSWGLDEEITTTQQILSERELEILTLLTQGHRDRDIANHLIISESTVKFHINNVLTKLKTRTRYQALHQVIVNGWIR